MPVNPQSLLILSCSERKDSDIDLLPAIQRYDGPTFRLLRRFLKENLSEKPDILILSAQFGLIRSDLPIPNYDQPMSVVRARELQPQVISKLKEILVNQVYQRLCICMGKDYLQALYGYDTLISSRSSIRVISGPQGKKLSELYEWLYDSESEYHQKSSVFPFNGKARLRGIEISMTPAQVLDKAREFLRTEQSHSANYQLWYVLVDEQKVSPKWLVSHLTGLPVSSFQAREARNVLQHLGIGVHHL